MENTNLSADANVKPGGPSNRELLIEQRRAVLSEVEAYRQIIRAKLAVAANLARQAGLTEKL
jgi:hypothetical protein